MKKTSTGARLTSAMMACVLALSMCGAPAAYAVTNDPSSGANSGEGVTSFTLQSIDGVQEFGGTEETDDEYANPDANGDGLGDNLAFTVPTQINYIANKDGELLAPTNVTVQNRSDDNAYVSSLQVEIGNSWNVVKTTDEIDTETVEENTIALKVGVAGDMLEAKDYEQKSFVHNPSKWNMTEKDTTKAKLPLAFEGKVYNVTNNIKTATEFGGAHWYLAKGKGENPDAKAFDFGEGATYDATTGKVSVENGYYTVSADGWDGKGAEPSDEVTLTFGSDGDYRVGSVTVHDVANDVDVDVTLSVVENTATFTMPNGEISISATFIAGKYDLDHIKTSGVGWNDESSWEEISYALQAHYASVIDLTDSTTMGDNVWKIGNTKTVHLNSFSCVGADDDGSIWDYASGDTTTKRPVEDKDVTFVIADVWNHSAYKMTDNANVSPVFIVQQVEIGAFAQMNLTRTNEGGWAATRLHQHLQPGGLYYDALEKGFTDLLKTVKVPGAEGNGSKTVQYSDDKLFLPTEYEVSKRTGYADTDEGTQQWTYYATKTNYIKSYPVVDQYTYYYNHPSWWKRSPTAVNNHTDFCCVRMNNGEASDYMVDPSSGLGLAPAGCI